MQKPSEAFKHIGKSNELNIFVVKTIKPRESTIARIFSSEAKPEVRYEVHPVSPHHHGVFYIEDLYVVIKTNQETKKKELHFWFGKAYKENPPPWIDNFESLELDWTANQHYEFQGRECELFESYFDSAQPAIRYKRGSHPDPSAARERGVTRFYKLERQNQWSYRVREIPFDIELMTREECFILDTDYNTRAYVSDRTPIYEKNKSAVIINNLRDLEHDGNGYTEVVDLTTFANEADKEAYVKAYDLDVEDLPPRVNNFDEPDEDPKDAVLSMVLFIFDDEIDVGYPPRFLYAPKPKLSVPEVNNVSFCARLKKNVSNGMRTVFGYEKEKPKEIFFPCLEERFLKTTVTGPYKREMLESKKCYVLEGSTGKGIFMWVGKACDRALQTELTESLRNELRKDNNDNEVYPNLEFVDGELGPEVYEKKDEKKVDKKKEDEMVPRWTHIYKVIEGNEPVKFKRYFKDWE